MKLAYSLSLLILLLAACGGEKIKEEPLSTNISSECQITIDQSVVVDTTICPITINGTDKITGKYIYGLEVYLAYELDTVKLVTDSAGYAGGYYGYDIKSIRVVKEGYGECQVNNPEIDQERSHCLQINVAMPGVQ
ncbi:MAG TPA: hypothetical protein VK177_00145 [Flavobacteriales bacterium]|nr:hypothetical protein [Flavobacteriales bacterium]